MEDPVTWSNVVAMAVGYTIGKAVSSYFIWKKYFND
jgi:hypothetical protein